MFGVSVVFDDTRPGAIVAEIVPEGLAQQMEFTAGDALLSINRQLLNTLGNFAKVDLSLPKIEVLYQCAQDAKLHRRTAVIFAESKICDGNPVTVWHVTDIMDEL